MMSRVFPPGISLPSLKWQHFAREPGFGCDRFGVNIPILAVQDRPLRPLISGVITPKSRVIIPVAHLFSAIL